jgi:molybdopterin-guanine dinucleotide biosynthesis protein A
VPPDVFFLPKILTLSAGLLMQQPAGVILAGGQSTRMGGGDKGLLKLAGKSLLDHVIDRLEPQVSDLVLNINGDPSRFNTNLPCIQDSIDGFAGPLAGVLAGLDWAAAQGHTHIVTAAADTPFFPCDLVPRLLLAAETAPIALAATPENGRINRHPTFGLWPTDLRDDLRAALEEGLRKVVMWTDKHGTVLAEFSTDPFDPFFNVNTPEDMELAEGMLL